MQQHNGLAVLLADRDNTPPPAPNRDLDQPPQTERNPLWPMVLLGLAGVATGIWILLLIWLATLLIGAV